MPPTFPAPMLMKAFGKPYTSVPPVMTTAMPPATKNVPSVAIRGGTLR